MITPRSISKPATPRIRPISKTSNKTPVNQAAFLLPMLNRLKKKVTMDRENKNKKNLQKALFTITTRNTEESDFNYDDYGDFRSGRGLKKTTSIKNMELLFFPQDVEINNDESSVASRFSFVQYSTIKSSNIYKSKALNLSKLQEGIEPIRKKLKFNRHKRQIHINKLT